jgi:hypothetical protein
MTSITRVPLTAHSCPRQNEGFPMLALLPSMPSLPEIDSTIEIVAVSSTAALIIAGVIAFIYGTIHALTNGPDESQPSADLRDRF